MFRIQIGLKQGDALPQLLLNSDLEYAIRKIEVDLVGMGHISIWLMLMMWIYWELI
jgi:hypothetical protein